MNPAPERLYLHPIAFAHPIAIDAEASMQYPSVSGSRRLAPAPQEIEVGVEVVGSTRIRCLLDPDWGSVMCFRIAPGELSAYLGVLTGPDTATPNLHLVSEHGWRFPTPETREALRQTVLDLYRCWIENR
ncbi:hypothetical protein GCM10009853_043110 [Glycomyces scopariae]